jgi:hypothetical protein
MDHERFLDPGTPLLALDGRTVGDFWRWAYSDVISNGNRSVFAEFMVGTALGCLHSPRVEWDAVDLRYGKHRIEVKASAFCQSWHQERLSTIKFSISKARAWDPRTGEYSGVPTRFADAYVFCLHTEKDKEKAKCNVLDASTWEFYVSPTQRLNQEFGEGNTISLSSVQRVGARCGFAELKASVDAVLEGLWAAGRIPENSSTTHSSGE